MNLATALDLGRFDGTELERSAERFGTKATQVSGDSLGEGEGLGDLDDRPGRDEDLRSQLVPQLRAVVV